MLFRIAPYACVGTICAVNSERICGLTLEKLVAILVVRCPKKITPTIAILVATPSSETVFNVPLAEAACLYQRLSA